MENKEFRGEWWLPNNPYKKISGTLKIDEETDDKRYVLELNDSFKNDFNSGMLNEEIILGITIDQELITLYKSIRTESNLVGKNHVLKQYETFTPSYIFFNGHFNNLGEMSFKSFIFTFDYLGCWLWVSGFTQETDKENVHLLNYVSQEDIDLYQKEDLKIFIKFNYKSQNHMNLREFHFYEFLRVFISTSEEKNLNYYLKLLNKIMPFFEFSISKKIKIHDICLSNSKNDFSMIINPPCAIKKDYHVSHKELMPYSLIKDEIGDLFSRWMDTYENWDLKVLKKLYFLTLDNDFILDEAKYIAYVQIIEKYCATQHIGYYIDEKEYEKIFDSLVNNIPEQINEDLKKNIINNLKYSNFRSLIVKFRKLINSYQKLLEIKIFKNKKERDNFIENVINTRDYLTHYHDYLKEETTSTNNIQFHQMIEMLRFLSEITVMKLFFNDKQIKKIILNRYLNNENKKPKFK